ncbi:MAG: helix-turn-helix domain-containing protein [Oscillospiraceae bacterium]|nr:helix-turn-helix domain-containing protein [Oscillospiraceae bacterium]
MNDMWLNYFTNDESFPFFIQYGGHDDSMFIHGHADFSELVIVMDGTAEHIVENERFVVKKGDVFVMGRDIRHGYNNAEDFRICNIMFRPEALLNGDHDIKQYAGFHALFLLEAQINDAQGFSSRLKLSHSDFTELERLTNMAMEEYGADLPGKKTRLMSLFMQIVVMLSRLYDAPAKLREIGGMAEAAAFMENHYMEDITIEQVLEISHYSQRHFIRLFSAAYNTTPQKYLMNIRIRRACALLRETALPITEIALRCGFSDSNYFSRAFRKVNGITPSQYRNTAEL